MRTVTTKQVATTQEATTGELPDRVQEALGELAGAAKEGLLALSVGVGLGRQAILALPESAWSAALDQDGAPRDHDRHRFQAILTDHPEADIAVLEGGHRARARVDARASKTASAPPKTPVLRTYGMKLRAVGTSGRASKHQRTGTGASWETHDGQAVE